MTAETLKSLIPAFPGGKPTGRLYPAGAGLMDDREGETEDTAYLQIIRDAEETDFLLFCDTLDAEGFVCLFSRDAAEGLYREYEKDGVLLYTYYIFAERTARVILDNGSTPLPAFEEAPHAVTPFGNTALMQYALHYDKMIPGYSCDCGMLYAVRLRSGHLILVDGGEKEQATDAAVADCVKKLRLLTGSKKLTVSLWYCTHPHDDHMDFFMKLLRVLGDDMEVRRVAFNFPSNRLLKLPSYIPKLKERLKTYAPGAKFLRLHAGMRFMLENAEVEVLHAHDDALNPDGWDTPFDLYDGINETCAVVRLTFEDKSLILLGDVGHVNAKIMMRRYKTLSCDYLQASHHCINRILQVYRNTKAETVLIPQGTYNLERGCRRNFQTLCRIYGKKNILNGDETRLFFDDPVQSVRVSLPKVGSVFDGSEL